MEKQEIEKPQPLFKALDADDPDPETTEIESLCLNCGDNGITRLLLTKIPFYKEVVLMSFECEHCGFKNNEIQQGGQFEEKGVRITLHVNEPRDLNRQVIKSDYSSIKIPEIDFEIPSQSQKGEVTTVEGILERVCIALTQDQDQRREENPEIAENIDRFVEKIVGLKSLDSPFKMIFEDISGNLFVENPDHPHKDHNCETSLFVRSTEQNHLLGLYTQQEIASDDTAPSLPLPAPSQVKLEDFESEVLQFPTNCPECAAPCDTNMKLTKIPHFKEVVIMATNCDACGHRTNEVKAGGGIEELGLRLSVKVTDSDDLKRDILKSETCSLEVPELDLEVGPAALGGRFTTVEGLLCAIRDQLAEKGGMFTDSETFSARGKMAQFLERIDAIVKGQTQVTLVLDDPAGNSYIQSLNDDNSLDDRLTVSKYERTHEQNDDLGLNDMKTENYEES
ncbi:zinc finger protein ZPR1 [Nilaparvata lugens]|uniref:zinc finger protein ZPR1 n=1 Tax=Nilaparvata lugens TaxID=108931 RepID=UPI000B97FFE4|nr:zinc finger protein ZPR1 [Nilaparvata lugens]